MRATCFITFVEPTPKGMLVGNPGNTVEIHDEALFDRLLTTGKISAAESDYIGTVVDAPLAGVGEAIQLPNADGSPMLPPPSTAPVAKAEPKPRKPRVAKAAKPAALAASPVDAPVE
jgi:hypothetical protein